jgi:ribose/xylose/arabinose/galactoside ABC-type transport system permease subunit
MFSAKTRRVIAPVVATLGLASIFLAAVSMVMKGRGAEGYSNVYGMFIHWTSVVVLFAVGLIAFIVALLMRWWQLRQWTRLERDLARGRAREH